MQSLHNAMVTKCLCNTEKEKNVNVRMPLVRNALMHGFLFLFSQNAARVLGTYIGTRELSHYFQTHNIHKHLKIYIKIFCKERQ